MVAQIAQCDPSQAASSLEQAEGDIKTAVLLALGIDKTEAEILLMRYDGNLRRVFTELSGGRDRHPNAEAARGRGKAVEP
jgi:N-acetylmuramic acid 6-phosphate etherase